MVIKRSAGLKEDEPVKELIRSKPSQSLCCSKGPLTSLTKRLPTKGVLFCNGSLLKKQMLRYDMDVVMSGSGCGDDDSWILAQE